MPEKINRNAQRRTIENDNIFILLLLVKGDVQSLFNSVI